MAVEANVQLLAARLRCPLCLGPLEGDAPERCSDCATAYHRTCVVELGVACTTLGCARGPRPPQRRAAAVTAEPPQSELPRTGLAWPLVLTWLLYLPWPLGLVAWAWALLRASRRGGGALAMALLGSPFVVVPAGSAVAGLHGYLTGTASLTGPYFDDSRVFTGLDPQVRCEVRPDASLGPDLGPHLLSNGPYEVVLRGLTAAFGPMPGSYAGPIPTPEGAAALLLRAPAGPPLAVEDPPIRALGAATRVRLLVPLRGGRVEVDLPEELHGPVQGSLDVGASRVAWVNPRVLLVAAGPSPSKGLLVDLSARRVVALLRLTP